MTEYIPASQLGSAHIGKTVRVILDKAEAEDVLVRVSHHSTMISEGPIFEPPRLTPGRIETTLTFQKLGEVECGHSQKVRIVD